LPFRLTSEKYADAWCQAYQPYKRINVMKLKKISKKSTKKLGGATCG